MADEVRGWLDERDARLIFDEAVEKFRSDDLGAFFAAGVRARPANCAPVVGLMPGIVRVQVAQTICGGC